MIEIYSTSRRVREHYSSFGESAILPKAITIAEFERKALHVKDRVQADEDIRVLLMRQACNFSRFEDLKIERDFFVFLKNSEFLFRFFEELSSERVEIDDLELSDTYAEFSEHLEILKIVLKNYTELMDKEGLYDRITLVNDYALNEDYLRQSGGFLLHLDGFLSRFELEIFDKISKITEFKIEFELSGYNKKLMDSFSKFSLKPFNSYLINLTTSQIESQTPVAKRDIKATAVSFPSRLLQCAFVQEQIAKFVKEGIEPDKIVVILPDEKFSKLLKEFDRYGNLNFAMGESYENSTAYKRLYAIERYLKYGDFEDIYRIRRVFEDSGLVERFGEIWNKRVESEKILSVLEEIEKECDIYKEELFKFGALLSRVGSMEFQKALRVFLDRLKVRKIDDVKGGRVTVMGVLESRGMSYDGVIIVDFNDEFIPKRSSKDLFLNSAIRSFAKLPTKNDRENLQRDYYYKLIKRAEKVAVSFVENEKSFISRFAEELGIDSYKRAKLPDYFYPIFKKGELKAGYEIEDLKKPHFIQRLSPSKLKTLLTCKRKYYFRYLLFLKDVQIPTVSIDDANMGNLLHEALHSAFENLKEIDKRRLESYIKDYLYSQAQLALEEFYAEIWFKRLKSFVETEVSRYNEGYRALYLEKSFEKRYKNIVLEGNIDRIDFKDGELFIIDYKSGKVPKCSSKSIEKCTDFQLEFYYLLASDLGNIKDVFYYDLKEGELIKEPIFDMKLERLIEILDELQKGLHSFPMCEKLENCRWCEYANLCQRELL